MIQTTLEKLDGSRGLVAHTKGPFYTYLTKDECLRPSESTP